MKVYSINPEDVRKAREFLKSNNHRIAPECNSETIVKMANQLKQDLIKHQGIR